LAEAEAEKVEEWFTGGTMHPLLYYTALKVLTSDRISQLGIWLGTPAGPGANRDGDYLA
jgi:hypothetical protein